MYISKYLHKPKMRIYQGSSGLSSERIILSPFTKEFRGEGHSYESLTFSGATIVASNTRNLSLMNPQFTTSQYRIFDRF